MRELQERLTVAAAAAAAVATSPRAALVVAVS
jgi:hypothetical protein